MNYQYSFQDVTAVLGGSPILLQELSYGVKQEQKKVHCMGSANPIFTVPGKKTYEGSIKIVQSEFERLVASLPKGKTPLDMKGTDIIISYLNEDNILVIDKLKGCAFKEFKKAMKVDDSHMEIDLPFEFDGIVLQAV